MSQAPGWTWPALVVVLLAAVNLLNGVWWRSGYLVTCPVAAGLLLGLGRAGGLSWRDLGLGRDALGRGLLWAAGAVAVVGVAYVALSAVPFARAAAAPSPGGPGVARVLAEITLGTVLLEEVAFRGVLWGLVAAAHGVAPATAVTSVLFGLWHVVPSFSDTGVQRPGWLAATPGGGALWSLGTVLVTAVVGVVLAELRRRSGSLLAPMGLHWAINSLGVVFRAAVSP